MSKGSVWYDPICYQFVFYMIDKKGPSAKLVSAYQGFLEELKPYFERWISLGGRLLSRIHRPQNGFLLNEFREVESFRQYSFDSARLDQCLPDEYEIAPVASRVPRQFNVPVRKIDKTWKEQVLLFADLQQCNTIDKEKQKEWILYLLNCPTDDLQGVCFPKSCFLPGSVPFVLQYQCMDAMGTLAYADEVLEESGVSSIEGEGTSPWCIHRLSVSIPRYVFSESGNAFPFQERWIQRLKELCGEFETSVGYMKMDCYTEGRTHPLRSGCGNFKLGFNKKIPDIGWAMGLSRNQIDSLGGLEFLKSSAAFCRIESMENGNIYLQLTEDISSVPIDTAKGMWRIFSKCIERVENYGNSIANVPSSMRLGIECDKLHMNNYGEYYFTP